MANTQNKHWADDKSKFGYKMLQKMGWKGKGLGKQEDGVATHVKITKRANNLGLGTEDLGSNNDRIDAYAGLRSWERTNDNFSNVLASLNAANKSEVKKVKKHKKKKSKKESKTGASPMGSSSDAFRNVIRKKELVGKNVSSMSAKDIALIVGGRDSKKKKRKRVYKKRGK